MFEEEESEDSNLGETRILASLIYKEGSTQGHRLTRKLDIADHMNNINIGRNPEWGDLILTDVTVSRRHATITIDQRQQLIIEDEGSSGGTYINTQKLQPGHQRQLQHGDKVSFGGHVTYRVQIN